MNNKTMTKLGFVFAGSFIFFVCAGYCQAPAPNSVLSWQDCVSLAAKNNPAFASSRFALVAGQSSYYGSYNGILPQVNLSHSYSNSQNANTITGTGNNATWESQASASLNLFNMSQFASIKASRALMEQAEAGERTASALLRFNLSKAFYQLLFAQQNVLVSQNIVSMRDEESQLVTLRYNSGTEYKGNMLRAKAQLLQAKLDLAQAQRDIRTAQRALGRQLGYSEFIVIVATAAAAVRDPGDIPSDEQLILNQRPDISIQKAIVKSAEASLDQASSALWPALSANYSLASANQNENETFQNFQSEWGVMLNYPLFGGGPTYSYYARKAATNNLQKARQDLVSLSQQAVVDIETSWANLKGAIDQSVVANSLLEASRMRNDEANIRYDSGLMTYDNWEIIASDRINQERQAIQAELNAMDAEASWENSLGKQLEE